MGKRVWETFVWPPVGERLIYYSAGMKRQGTRLILVDVRDPIVDASTKPPTVKGVNREGDTEVVGLPHIVRQVDQPKWWG